MAQYLWCYCEVIATESDLKHSGVKIAKDFPNIIVISKTNEKKSESDSHIGIGDWRVPRNSVQPQYKSGPPSPKTQTTLATLRSTTVAA